MTQNERKAVLNAVELSLLELKADPGLRDEVEHRLITLLPMVDE